jgi:hypothetical protein
LVLQGSEAASDALIPKWLWERQLPEEKDIIPWILSSIEGQNSWGWNPQIHKFSTIGIGKFSGPERMRSILVKRMSDYEMSDFVGVACG